MPGIEIPLQWQADLLRSWIERGPAGGMQSRSLIKEIAEGQSAVASLKIINEHCQVSDAGQALRAQAEIHGRTTPKLNRLGRTLILDAAICRSSIISSSDPASK